MLPLPVWGLSHPAGMFPPSHTFTRTMRPLCSAEDLSVPAGGLAFVTIVMVIATASQPWDQKLICMHSQALPDGRATSTLLPADPSGSHSSLGCVRKGQAPGMLLAWGEGGTEFKGAPAERRQAFTQAGSRTCCCCLAVFLWEMDTFCISPFPAGFQYKPPSGPVNRRGVFWARRRLVSGGTRPNGGGNGLFFSSSIP